MNLQKDTQPTVTGGNIWTPPTQTKQATPPSASLIRKPHPLREAAEYIGIFLTLAGIATTAIIGITTLPQALKEINHTTSQITQNNTK